METAASSWGDMPSDIGHLIIARLPEVVEHIRFGAVCEQWYFISKEYHQEELLKPRKDVLPMLLIPSPDTPVRRDPPRLYALSYHGKYYSNLQLQLSIYNSNRYNRYCGSSYGWIIFQDEINGTVTLVYPFGREVVPIHLPGLNHRIEAHGVQLHKLFVLPGSTPDDYAAVAIYGGTKELATIKSGEKSWVYIPPQLETTLPALFFSDIVFYQGHVYAVSGICMIVKVDIQARPPIVKIMQPLINLEEHTHTYLVESISSDLFLLQRLYDYSDRSNELKTIGFNIHKLKEENGQLIFHMKDLKDLNGDTFFVGDNTSMAIQSNSCMPNSIYFTDDLNDSGYCNPRGPIDVGYYNIEDGTIGHYYKANPAHKKCVSRPFWIVPHQHIH